MLSLRLDLDGANGLLMLLLLREELPSRLRGIESLFRDLERDRDLEHDSRLDWDKPVSAKVLVRELEREVPDILKESPVR